MAVVGTFTDTRTIAAAATASGGFAHGIAAGTPHMVWACASYATASLSTNFPYFAASKDSASVTFYNRGLTAETYSVYTQYLHSIQQ